MLWLIQKVSKDDYNYTLNFVFNLFPIIIIHPLIQEVSKTVIIIYSEFYGLLLNYFQYASTDTGG